MNLTYVGSINDMYPIDGILEAIKGIDIELLFIGNVSSPIRDKLKGHRIINYVDHTESIRYMIESEVLLLIIPRHIGNDMIITGKIYEYIAARKPILCIGPVNGDASDILKQCGHGRCFDYDDIEGMRNFLLTIME